MAIIKNIKQKPLAVIIVLSIVFRLYLLVEFPNPCCGSDENTFTSVAKNIITEHQFVLKRVDDPGLWTENWYDAVPPLYPYFLAGMFKIFGMYSVWVKIVQIAISAISGYFIFKITERTFSYSAGIFALIIHSFFWELAYATQMFLTENLYWFLLVYLVFLLLRSDKSLIAEGVIIGLLVLVRPASILFPFTILVWKLLKRGVNIVQTFRAFAVIFIFSVLTITPWMIRNYKIFNQFVFVNTEGMISIWMGNHLGSGGTYNVPDPDDPEQTPVLKSEGVQREIERNNFFKRKAIEYIKKYPIDAIDTDLKKIVWTFKIHRPWMENTTYNSRDWILSRPAESWFVKYGIEHLIDLQFAALYIFFLLGAVTQILLRPKNEGFILMMLMVATHLAIIAMSHSQPRYVWQIYPFMVMIAAVPASVLYLALRGKSKMQR